MPGNPAVAVITPFFNASKYLREAIESVLGQTYGNWEYVLVDDGSTDQSRSIVEGYVHDHPDRIRLLNHSDGGRHGISASRNHGIRESRGKYIAMLDADDVWLPNKLEDQVPLLDARPEAGMVYGDTVYWHSWQGEAAREKPDYRVRLGVRPNALLPVPRLLQLTLNGLAAVPSISNALLRREVVERVGGFEEEFRTMYEDQVFYAKMFLAAPVYPSAMSWDRYRQHPESVCAASEKVGELQAARTVYLHWLEEYLLAGGFEGTDVWKALQREIRFVGAPPLERRMRRLGRRVQRRVRALWI